MSFRGAVLNRIIGHRDAGRISGDGTACPGNAGYAIVSQLIVATRGRVAYGYPLGGLDVGAKTTERDPGRRLDRRPRHADVTDPGPRLRRRRRRRWDPSRTRPAPDVGRKYPQLGNNHGYSHDDPGRRQGRTRCASTAISVGNGGNRQLGCRFLSGDTMRLTRRTRTEDRAPWSSAAGPSIPTPRNSVPIHVYVDGVGAAIGTRQPRRAPTSQRQPRRTGPRTASSMTVPVTGNHGVCVYAISTRGKREHHARLRRASAASRAASLDKATRPRAGRCGSGVGRSTPTRHAPITVHVYVDGVGRAIHTANTLRPDIAGRSPGSATATASTSRSAPRPRRPAPGLRLRHQRRASAATP